MKTMLFHSELISYIGLFDYTASYILHDFSNLPNIPTDLQFIKFIAQSICTSDDKKKRYYKKNCYYVIIKQMMFTFITCNSSSVIVPLRPPMSSPTVVRSTGAVVEVLDWHTLGACLAGLSDTGMIATIDVDSI